MLLDFENLFSNAQAITADAVSENVIDLGDAKDHGPGEELPLLIQVVEDFDNLTSLTITLQTDTVEGFASPTVLQVSDAVVLASLVAGYKFRLRVPSHGLQQFLRLDYNVTGTNPTVGKITAGIVVDNEQNYQ